jgi:hypothetical protein
MMAGAAMAAVTVSIGNPITSYTTGQRGTTTGRLRWRYR